MRPLCVIAYTRYPARAASAPTKAYGNWVETWVATAQAAPVLDRMVVSEIGELWSPHTEPARTAPKLAIKKASPPGTAFIMSPARGIKIPKAPQEVPVAKAIRAADAQRVGLYIAGRE